MVTEDRAAAEVGMEEVMETWTDLEATIETNLEMVTEAILGMEEAEVASVEIMEELQEEMDMVELMDQVETWIHGTEEEEIVMVPTLRTLEVEVVILETVSMEEDMDQEMGSVEIMVPVEAGMDMVEIMEGIIMVPTLRTPEVEVDLVAILETISMEGDMDTWDMMLAANMEETMDQQMDSVEPEMEMVEILGEMEAKMVMDPTHGMAEAEMAILTVSGLVLSLAGQH